MNLTIEEQRKLTEFLGECWHEYNPNYDQGNSCSKCGKTVFHRFHRTFPQNLDFTDWRVVGRLLSNVKERGKTITMRQYSYGRCYVWFADDEDEAAEAPSLEEAICRAVLAYLETQQ